MLVRDEKSWSLIPCPSVSDGCPRPCFRCGAVLGFLVAALITYVVQHFRVHLEYIERKKTGKALDGLSARILDQRVDLQKQREIFANEVRKFHAGKGSREACVDAKNTWHETLEHLSNMDPERLKMELRQSIGDDPLVIHQEPEIPSSPASPNLLLNLTFGTLGGLLIGGLMGMIHRPRTDVCI
jgi:hypothetical protein